MLLNLVEISSLMIFSNRHNFQFIAVTVSPFWRRVIIRLAMESKVNERETRVVLGEGDGVTLAGFTVTIQL